MLKKLLLFLVLFDSALEMAVYVMLVVVFYMGFVWFWYGFMADTGI